MKLVHGGLLIICTDNSWYAELLCRVISELPQYTSLTSRGAGMDVDRVIDGITLFSGVPGKEVGVPARDGASSYFDRMFQSGLSNHASAFDRYTVCVRAD